MTKARQRERAKKHENGETQISKGASIWLSACVLIGLTTGAAYIVNMLFFDKPTSYAVLAGLSLGTALAYLLARNRAVQNGIENGLDAALSGWIWKLFD